jgi:hypothetical protein
MKRTIGQYEFVNLLMNDEYAKWTREAAFALWDYYEDLENDSGKEIEFCLVSFRLDWNLCASAFEVAERWENVLKVNPKDFDADNPHDCELIQKQIDKALDEVGSYYIKLESGAYLIYNF